MELRAMIARSKGTKMKTARTTLTSAALLFAMVAFIGCQSKQDAAIEQAKRQAAATGQAQQVVSVDKSGNTVTTTVEPPAPGQKGQQVTTTVTPPTSVPATTPPVPGGQPAT